MAGESLTLNKNSGCGDYQFYNTESKPDLLTGEQYSISVTMQQSNQYAKLAAWIDYNNDGPFGYGEDILMVAGTTGVHTNQFTVPSTVTPGTYRMRVRTVSGEGANWDPCVTFYYANGEAEDYLVTITTASAPSCTDPIVSISGSTTICPGESTVLDAGNAGLTFEWNTGETTQTIEVNEAGTYDVTVTDGACSTTSSINIIEAPLPSSTGIQTIGTDLCVFNFEVLNGQNITSYSWDFGDG